MRCFFVGSYDLELDIDPFFSVIITHCMLDSPGVFVCKILLCYVMLLVCCVDDKKWWGFVQVNGI